MTGPITPELVLDLILEHQIIDAKRGEVSVSCDLFALGMDSMALMQLLLHLEDRFGVTVEPAEMTRARFASARALADFLAAKQPA